MAVASTFWGPAMPPSWEYVHCVNILSPSWRLRWGCAAG